MFGFLRLPCQVQQMPCFRESAAGGMHVGQWLWKQATAKPGPRGGSEAPARSGVHNAQRRCDSLKKLKQRKQQGEDLDDNQKRRFVELSATQQELAQFICDGPRTHLRALVVVGVLFC